MPTPRAEWPNSKWTPPQWLAVVLVLLLQLLVAVDQRMPSGGGARQIVHSAALLTACAALAISAIAVATKPRFAILPTAFLLIVLLGFWVLLFP